MHPTLPHVVRCLHDHFANVLVQANEMYHGSCGEYLIKQQGRWAQRAAEAAAKRRQEAAVASTKAAQPKQERSLAPAQGHKGDQS